LNIGVEHLISEDETLIPKLRIPPKLHWKSDLEGKEFPTTSIIALIGLKSLKLSNLNRRKA
jgi:hypothetical protein